MSLITKIDAKFEKIAQQLKADESDERRWAVYDLEAYAPDIILDYLIQAIQDEHRAVREAASEVLQTIPAEIATVRLVPLLGSEQIEVRNIVADILVKYGNGAINDLIPALFDPNEDVRKFAADILGLNGSVEAVEGLCKAALHDEVENVVVSSIEALGKIRSKEALKTLYEIVETNERMSVEATEAIGLIGELESAEFLENRLSKGDPMSAFAVIDALGNIGNESSLKVMKAYMEEAPEILQEQICTTILKIGQARQIRVLEEITDLLNEKVMELLKEGNETVADLVGFQLTLTPSPALLGRFFRYADQLPPSLLVTLINEVKGVKELLPVVIDLTKHVDDWVSYTAIEALVDFPVADIRSVVLDLLENPSGMSTVAAIRTVMQVELVDAIDALKELTKYDDEDIQAMASEALEVLT